jgi:beta-phosphoglucomutase-like phosphatase (HAD superfamily)
MLLWDGIAFDLDGVLWDSTPCHAEAFKEVLARVGVTGFHYEGYAGRRTAEVMRAEASRMGLDWSETMVRDLSREKTELARYKILSRRPVHTACATLLPELSSRWRIGLASSGSRGTVEMFLEMFQEMSGAREVFQSVLTGDDVNQAKPDPEIYLRTAALLGLRPERMLVVEDAVSGVMAGRAAGAPVVGIGTGSAAGSLRQAGAVEVVADLTELGDWLRGG